MSGKIFIVLDFPSKPERIREAWPVYHEWENLFFCWFSCYARQDTGIMTRLSWAGKSFFLLIFRGKIFFVLFCLLSRTGYGNLFLLIFLLSRTGYGKHDPFVVSGKIFLLFILHLSQTGYGKNDLFVMSGKIFCCCWFSFYARQDTGNMTCLSWVGKSWLG